MEIVDILSDEEQLIAPFRVESRNRFVGSIGLDRDQSCPPRIIKSVDECGISLESLRSCDIFDPMTFPKAVRPAKRRKAALGGNARAGEHDDVANDHARILVRESQ